ncbi:MULTISPECIES: hypothetical protein, partial [Salmonella]
MFCGPDKASEAPHGIFSSLQYPGYHYEPFRPAPGNRLNPNLLDLVTDGFACVFRSIRSRIGIEVRSAIRIHSINRELNFFYRFLTRFFAAFH